MIYWDESLATGIQVIDEDHQTLFGLLRVLQETVDNGGDADKSMLAIESLNEYAENHFKREEALMLLCGYPAHARHEAEHKKFHNTMKGLRAIYRENDSMVNLTGVIEFLKEWLYGHIAISDRAYISAMMKHKTLVDQASENLLANMSLDFGA